MRKTTGLLPAAAAGWRPAGPANAVSAETRMAIAAVPRFMWYSSPPVIWKVLTAGRRARHPCIGLTEQVDRAGPRDVAVFRRNAHVERVVTGAAQRYRAPEPYLAVRILLGQAEDADAAPQAARVEDDVVQPDLPDGDRALHERGLDVERPALRVAEPCIEAAVAAGGQGLPLEKRGRRRDDALVEIVEIDRRDALDRVAAQYGLPVPNRLAPASAIFGAFPHHANALAERVAHEGPERFQQLETVADLDALDRRRREEIDFEDGIRRLRLYDVAHHRARAVHARVRRENHAGAGRSVMMAIAQRLQKRGSRELRRENARQPAVRAEHRRTGIARARPALVAVAIGHDADTIALLERVLDQPVEGAPRGVYLDRAFQPNVVRHLDVRIAAADVREDDAIFVSDGSEEVGSRIGVARKIAQIFDERVRGTMYLPSFARVQHVAVSTQTGIARPFVTRKGDERPILVEFFRQLLEMQPKTRGDLKVVALMAGRIEKRAIAREREVIAR